MVFLKRMISLIFYIIVIYISVKHLGQGGTSLIIPLLMGLFALFGMLNALNPRMLGNFTNSQMRLPNRVLIVLSLIMLFMAGDLSKLIGVAENKFALGTSVIKDEEKEKLKEELAENKKAEEKEALKETEEKSLEDLTPEEREKRKEALNKGLEISLGKLHQDEAGGNRYYYSQRLENKTKKNQVFPYLIATNKNDMSDIHMNLWMRYSYVGDEQLDLKKFKIITDKEEYLMDAYDVNIDRDLYQNHLQPEDMAEDGTLDSDAETSNEESLKVWEWIEFSPNILKLDMLRDMASSKKVAIHYEGKSGSSERELTTEELMALREVLQSYDIFLEANK